MGPEVEDLCENCFNGKQALELVKENVEFNNFRSIDYDIIFMDCNMPFMDGYESTQEIKKFLTGEGIQSPFIAAVTGHSEQCYLQKCLNSGMDTVFLKPVDIKALTLVLRQ